jgi:tetratricopeptide (TPR) repeat protein
MNTNAANSSGDGQRGSKIVRDYVRGQRTTARLQLLIAVLAVAGLVFVGWKLYGWQTQLKHQADALTQSAADLDQRQKIITAFTTGAIPFQTGMIALGRGDYDTALSNLQQAVADAPSEPVFARSLATAQFQHGDYASAAQTGEQLLQITSADNEYRTLDQVNLGLAYYCAGDREHATAILTPDFVRANAAVVQTQSAAAAACTHAASNSLVFHPANEAAAAPPPAPATEAQTAATAGADAFKIRRVFLHIAKESDRADAIALAQSLCSAGYSMPGIQLITSASYPGQLDVRYYYAQQQQEAGQIASLVSHGATQAHAPAGWSAQARISQLTGYPNLPPERVEIWLPAGPDRQAQPGQRGFRC